MQGKELKERMLDDGYEVDSHRVADAIIARLGHRAVANALAGRPPLSDDGPSRAPAAPADLPPGAPRAIRPWLVRSS